MIDIIIPVYRPDDKLVRLIERLKTQTVKADHVYFMMTLTDQEENHRVEKILQTMDHATIVPVEKKDFDHGGTRNLGASLSKAEYMLFMTQDAVPDTDQLIQVLSEAFTNDKVATAYGRQLPDEKVGFVERYTRSFNYPDESRLKSSEDVSTLGIKTYFCSNVCAMYRKDVYEQLGGFVTETIFNEDMIMAAGVIGAGYQIQYVADAKVIHAHRYTYWQQLTRNFDLAVSQKQYASLFANVKSESEGIRLVKKTMAFCMKQGKWYLVPDLILQSGFKFLGYRLGKAYDKLPLWLVRFCSMNKTYWRQGKR